MSTMAAVPRDNRAPGFWASTVGKKMGLSVPSIKGADGDLHLALRLRRHLRLPDRALAQIFPGFTPPHTDIDWIIA